MWFAYNCWINFCQFSPFIYRLCEHIPYNTIPILCPLLKLMLHLCPPPPPPPPTPSKKKVFFFLFQVQEINIHVGLASKTQAYSLKPPWLSYLLHKLGVMSSILGFSRLSDESLNKGHVSVLPSMLVGRKTQTQTNMRIFIFSNAHPQPSTWAG